MSLRLHVFQHVAHEGLGSLESLFSEQGARITYTRLFEGETLPGLADVDMLVILGGPMNVYEFDKYPWLQDETTFIRAALDAGKPVLGLCLGAQLMSVALGGTVTRNEHREIGWWPVEKLPGVEGDLRAACFPARFTTYHWHGDTFSIPEGAISLFRSAGCAHQGFAWGPRAVGLQFHPEITAEAIDKWVEEAVAEGGMGGGDLKPGPYVQSAAAMREDAGFVADNNRWMENLCGLLMKQP
jgi:GMP synthase-like glutamine amidotransferase